jgi:hypothetical protein
VTRPPHASSIVEPISPLLITTMPVRMIDTALDRRASRGAAFPACVPVHRAAVAA